MIELSSGCWARLSIGEWRDRLSYLDDVPFDLLNAMIEGCQNHSPVSVKFNAEGYEYIVVIDFLDTYVIYEESEAAAMPMTKSCEKRCVVDDDCAVIHFKVPRRDLAAELIKDIRSDVKGWAEFYSVEPEEIGPRQLELLSLCRKLESLLANPALGTVCRDYVPNNIC